MTPWEDFRATVLAVLSTPRAVAQLFAIGLAFALFAWFLSELIRSLT